MEEVYEYVHTRASILRSTVHTTRVMIFLFSRFLCTPYVSLHLTRRVTSKNFELRIAAKPPPFALSSYML